MRSSCAILPSEPRRATVSVIKPPGDYLIGLEQSSGRGSARLDRAGRARAALSPRDPRKFLWLLNAVGCHWKLGEMSEMEALSRLGHAIQRGLVFQPRDLSEVVSATRAKRTGGACGAIGVVDLLHVA
jgi:hypothetical protein